MTTDYKLLIFDWDGTLMDSEAHIVASMSAAMVDLGIEMLEPPTIRNVIGLGMREAIHTLFPQRRTDEFVQAFTAAYRRHYFAPDAAQELFPGVEQMLRTLLERGYLLAVATGKSRAGLDRSLSETGLERLFHFSRTADETASKPDPRMLREILDQAELPAHRAIMIGDTEFDLEMASNAGTPSIGVSYGVHEPHRLQRHAPLACLDDLADLPEWLETNTDDDRWGSRRVV